MKEEELDALPWINGPQSGGIRGFCFRDKEDPQRYQEMYSTMHEKLWCEASGLIDAELWDEAEEKVEELRKYLGRCDMDLEAKLTFGIAMREIGFCTGRDEPCGIKDEHKFESARQALRFQIGSDGGSNLDELSKRLNDLVEARIQAIMPSKIVCDDDDEMEPDWELDYEKASLRALLQAAMLWLEVPKAAKSVYVSPTECTDNPHDATRMIVDELASRGEYKKARIVAREILAVDPSMSEYGGPSFFWAAIAECSEALGETTVAHESYVKLKKYDDYYCDDNESLACKNVMPGTLDDRIARSSVTASMN
mmetsp:Transcript_14387/g.22193  ORF Transcript_14387/g.22193 Transcript_14387/m.22193 type:complete len:310 (-) Transcript_14387:151-1080(-)